MKKLNYSKKERKEITKNATEIEWSRLWFAKYAGKTLPEILLSDPVWFFWYLEQGWFNNKGDKLIKEVKEIYRKAMNIRIRKQNGVKMAIEYDDFDYGFSRAFFKPFDVPAKDKENYEDTLIDLSSAFYLTFAWRKGRNIVKTQLEYLFGDKAFKLTRKECKEFFNDERNFYYLKNPEACGRFSVFDV